MSLFYKLQIKEVSRETSSSVSISFKIPLELKPNFTYVAGQYINLRLTLDGQEVRRAYSICSSPNSGELRIAIKEVKDGVFSTFANSDLKAGDLIELGTPEGKFTFEPQPEAQKSYAGFVAGSGITPVLSIIHSVLESETKSSFVLVYGNKTVADIMFYNQLHELQQKYIGRLFVHYVLSQQQEEDTLFGRIDKSVVNFILKNKHKEKEFSKFYLCGPEPMINLVTEVLKENNVSEKNIKFELFTASVGENEISAAPNDHTKITVVVDGDEATFEMSAKQTILDAALKQGLDAPYSCQGGICSSCLARVTSGTAEMKKNSILTDGEIAEGLILTCQAHPTSAEIVVDYDDV